MSLIGALNIGKSALATQQAALQVTGNNIANAGNADYTRQVAQSQPSADVQLRPGIFVGTGVDLSAITRQIDDALQQRLRSAGGDSGAADQAQQWLGRVEATFNELSDNDLSSELSTFFNSWSSLANNPADLGLRQVVIQSGQSVADWIQSLRNQLSGLEQDADDRLTALTGNADQLAQQVATLNQQIIQAEGGANGQANGLRDQRDAVLGQLAQLVDIKTVQHANGVVDVYAGSQPLVTGTTSRGLGLRQESVDGKLTDTIVVKADNGQVDATSGQIGGIMGARSQIDDVIDQVDTLAGNLIFELNKLHASGQGLNGFDSVSATSIVADPTRALNDPQAGLAFTPVNGSFVVHIKQRDTGLVTSTLVQVDLDGLGGNDTSLNSLAADLGSIDGVSSNIVAGQLRLSAASPNQQISFSQDTSGVLAALGINSFFTGSSARDIAVNSVVREQPGMLAASRNGDSSDNQTALAIANLESAPLAGLNGISLKASYQGMVNGVAVSAATAKTNLQAAQTVQDTLSAQRESLSGVSLDEEAINMMRQQRAFQAAARLVSAVDEMMKTILQMT